jgi:2-aminoadipate transaminase
VRLDTDPYLERYAARVRGMSASAIRALFAVASRPEIVSFAGGNPAVEALDLGAVEDVVSQVVRDSGATALQYGIGQGRPELREHLVGVMAMEGIEAHADELIVTAGGQQALELIASCFVDPGDIVIAEGPTYVGGIGALASCQADVRHVPMDDHGMRVDLLEELLDQLQREGRRPKYLYTIPNHQNPGGVSLSVERRQRLAELAEQHDVMVLEDNPYGLLDFAGKLYPSIRELVPERTIYVGTVSKTFAPGVRTGWIAAPAPVRDKLVLLREAADLCPSSLTQMVVETWFATQPWREQIDTFRDLYRTKAEAMLHALDEEMPAGVSWTRPSGAFYVWMTVPAGVDTDDLAAKAIASRVAFVPGRGFYADGSGGDQLRLCYSQPSPERIREGVSRLGELMHDELDLVRAVYGDAGAPPLRDRPADHTAPRGQEPR